ncbi:MAG: hypothetical protein AVDCRST_MAG69-230, partial [uncultured Solirubrobacteraceae bacterium]
MVSSTALPRRPARVAGEGHPPASPAPSSGRRTAVAISVAAVVSAISLPLVAPAPSYDPWAWLLWGREIGELRLSTAEGPAFKPLPVAGGALLALLGD